MVETQNHTGCDEILDKFGFDLIVHSKLPGFWLVGVGSARWPGRTQDSLLQMQSRQRIARYQAKRPNPSTLNRTMAPNPDSPSAVLTLPVIQNPT
jgi:hypothetical protein